MKLIPGSQALAAELEPELNSYQKKCLEVSVTPAHCNQRCASEAREVMGEPTSFPTPNQISVHEDLPRFVSCRCPGDLVIHPMSNILGQELKEVEKIPCPLI